jgi:TrpR family trp operon transcriptional repressor
MSGSAWPLFIAITEKLDRDDLSVWLDLLLTPAEKEDIQDRIEILKGLLEESLPQRELGEKLGVSISKISRGSNLLKTINSDKKEWLREKLMQKSYD